MLLAAAATSALPPAPADTGLRPSVVFGQYTPLSDNAEVLRRLLSPLAQQSIKAELDKTGRPMVAQSIDLANERFVIYAPARMPPDGYGLLVFVAPWQENKLPTGWGPVLDSLGIIFVSAARSGNDESPLGRRAPLALLAMHNIEQLYRVNLQQVYVGGFSGGSRVALRLALGYPDVFSGALLNAGSDPLGRGGPPLPPRDLFQKFQKSTRIVYVTGDKDSFHTASDIQSEKSLRKWCVHNFDARITPFVAHDIAGASAVAEALLSLENGTPSPSQANVECRAALDASLANDLKDAEALIVTGKRSRAGRLLASIDSEYGSLAKPQIIDLAVRCDCGLVSGEVK